MAEATRARIGDRGERDEVTPSGKSSATAAATLSASRVLPDAAGTGQGEQRHVLTQKQVAHRGQLPLPADERGAWQRHLGGTTRCKRRSHGSPA